MCATLPRPSHVVLIGEILQLAITVHFTNHTVIGMVTEQHLQHKLAGLTCLFAFGVNYHALKDWGGARRLQPSRIFHGHYAHAARANIAQIGMVAQGWYVESCTARGLQDSTPLTSYYLLAVNGQSDSHRIAPQSILWHRFADAL